MIQLQSIGILLCVLLAAGFLAYVPIALRLDRRDAHLLHKPGSGCVECDSYE
ncbi:membrane protein [Arthrobacter phage EvePickles]|nr:membrane protein [Arthrobacter phage EvePickles]